MPKIVYLNGQFLPSAEAKVSVFDRGLLFADAIYEVCGVIDGKLLDFPGHMLRLDRSLKEMGMICPLDHAGILSVMRRLVAEGAATSFFYIKDGKLVTRPLSHDILHGCTRRALIALVAEHGLTVEERSFTLKEAKAAEEAFITGASTYVCPVLSIDEAKLGDGKPGKLTRHLQKLYVDLARATAI